MKTKSNTFMISLLSLMFIANIATGITPALASINVYFSDIPQSRLQLIISIAALCSFFAALIGGILQDYLTQKSMVLLGSFFIGLGVIPVFYHTEFNYLLVVSFFAGSGSGLLTSIIPSIVARYFEGNEKSKMMGLKTGFQGLGTMFFTYIGGILAVFSWYYNFAIFFIGFIVFILTYLFFPKDDVLKTHKKVTEHSSSAHIFNGQTLNIFVFVGMLSMFSSIFANNLSLHTYEQSIGDASIAGLALSMMSLGTILAGFLSTRIVSATKEKTLFVGYSLQALGFFGVNLFNMSFGLVISATLFGIGYGLVMTRLLYILSNIVDAPSVPKAMSIFSATASFGFALSPLFINKIAKQISTTHLSTMSFLIGGVLSTCIVVYLLFRNTEHKIINSQINK